MEDVARRNVLFNDIWLEGREKLLTWLDLWALMTDWLAGWLAEWLSALHWPSLSAGCSLMINVDDVSTLSRLMTSYNWCQPAGQAHTDFLSYLLHLAGLTWPGTTTTLHHQQALNHRQKVRVWASGGRGGGRHRQVLLAVSLTWTW